MPVIPCSTSRPACTTCPDDFPVLNLSAEEPDTGDDFIGFWDSGDIPLGDPFGSKGCASTVYSNISQADADAKAKLQAKTCQGQDNGPPGDGCTDPGLCGNNPDDPGGNNDPGIPTPVAWNAEVRVSCPSGDLTNVSAVLPYYLSIDGSDLVCAPNVFSRWTQSDADATALFYTQQFFDNGIADGSLECVNPWLYTKFPAAGAGSTNCYCGTCPPNGTNWDVPGVTLGDTSFSINPSACSSPCVGGTVTLFGFTVSRTFGPYPTNKNVTVSGTAIANAGAGACIDAFAKEFFHRIRLLGLNEGTQTSSAGTSFPPYGGAPGFYNTPLSATGTLLAGQQLTVELTAQYQSGNPKSSSLIGTISITDAP